MKTILHRIKAYLYKYKLNNNPNEYSARPIAERTLDIKAICNSAVSRGNADISASAMYHAVELFFKEMEHNLCDGYAVNTGTFIATPVIKGVFHNPKETFNPAKHTVLFQFKQGKSLRKKLSTVEVEVAGTADHQMYIATITDMRNGSVNGTITPQHNIRIKGRYLKLAGDHPDVGVRFINIATNEKTNVPMTELIDNRQSTLLIMAPALETGCYRLEITTMYTTSGTLKQPRTATSESILKVL